MTAFWRRCSSCKREIAFERAYWTCSVSTCNRKRTALQFCSVRCWEAHLPVARHRDAWAEEQRSPSRVDWVQAQQQAATDESRRRLIRPAARADVQLDDDIPRETLVVVTKVKNYVRARGDMKTSDRVMDALSEHLRQIADRAIREAARDERKTVLDRDIRAVLERDFIYKA